MANEQFTIDLGDQQAVLVTDDDAWLREKLRQEPGATRIRVRYDEDEVEGHRYGAGLGVRVIADDLDTEGHAIALHFPSREEADAFRKRLMLGGVLAGTVVLGTAAGIARRGHFGRGHAEYGHRQRLEPGGASAGSHRRHAGQCLDARRAAGHDQQLGLVRRG